MLKYAERNYYYNGDRLLCRNNMWIDLCSKINTKLEGVINPPFQG